MRIVPLALVCVACTNGTVVVRVPLDGRSATIARPDRAGEREHGLAAGTLTHWVSLSRLDGTTVCFDVVLRSLEPLELRSVRAVLEVPGQTPIEQAELWPQEPTQREVPGLLVEREERGFYTECAKQDHAGICLAYETRPSYRAVKRAGLVAVHEARGRMCYPNASHITSGTPELRLSVEPAGEATEQYRFRLAH